jgi:hypothetical protein
VHKDLRVQQVPKVVPQGLKVLKVLKVVVEQQVLKVL